MSTYTKPVKEALETVFTTAESTNKAVHGYSLKAVDATFNLVASSIAANKAIADRIIARFAEQSPAPAKPAATAKKTVAKAAPAKKKAVKKAKTTAKAVKKPATKKAAKKSAPKKAAKKTSSK